MFFLLQGANFEGVWGGFFVGFYFAAFVGVFVVPACGLVARVRGLRGRRSLRMMTVAGGLTGLVSGIVLGPLCLITCAVGNSC